jgi:hypothetical protein
MKLAGGGHVLHGTVGLNQVVSVASNEAVLSSILTCVLAFGPVQLDGPLPDFFPNITNLQYIKLQSNYVNIALSRGPTSKNVHEDSILLSPLASRVRYHLVRQVCRSEYWSA